MFNREAVFVLLMPLGLRCYPFVSVSAAVFAGFGSAFEILLSAFYRPSGRLRHLRDLVKRLDDPAKASERLESQQNDLLMVETYGIRFNYTWYTRNPLTFA